MTQVEEVGSIKIEKPEVTIRELNNERIQFEIKNIHTSMANALRRILLSEIPTMAIEKVLMEFNTSLIPDEVAIDLIQILSHRLGLIPIYCDPSSFQYHTGHPIAEDCESVLVFDLKVHCKSTKTKPQEPGMTVVDRCVYSSHLKWIPIGNQGETFKDNPPHPVHPNILIAKLAPGQEIILRAHCHKGIGEDHSKFSPVGNYVFNKATASYRMMPKVSLKERICGEDAQKLQTYFSPGVINLTKSKDGQIEASVNQNHIDSMSYNVKLDPNFEKRVEILRIPNHFIFNIESTGIIPPEVLFKAALEILITKCQKFLDLSQT